MSDQHLTKGTPCPPKTPGKLRLYSMKFCPFAQRVRIVLNAKKVPHEIVNVNLKNKPDWLFDLQPEGKVPVLDTGDKIVTESLDIADFLDEKYPEPPLYPADSEKKEADKELIKKYGEVVSHANAAIYGKDGVPLETHLEMISKILDDFEEELTKRGTTFFGGGSPGMVDYMLWPWVERAKVSSLLQGKEFQFPRERFPKLVSWRSALKEDEAVKSTLADADTHANFTRTYLSSSSEVNIDDF